MRGDELKQFLLKYDCPSIAENTSFKWGQNLIARYLAWKINTKLDRYNRRLKRDELCRVKQ